MSIHVQCFLAWNSDAACDVYPCENGATCFDGGGNEFICICPEHYSGVTCGA